MAYTVDPRIVDPLVVGRVIGDVVDRFVPSASLSVYYGTKHVTNGCNVKPSLAITPPNIRINGHVDHLYTLVMTDPDAPSPSDPGMRELVHWLVVDIPGSNTASKGKEILPYLGPHPPVGIHRYVFVVFRQKSSMMGVVNPPTSRAHFSTRNFSDHHDLHLPIAVVYFNSQKEPMSKRRSLN